MFTGKDGRPIYGYRIVDIQPTTNRWQPWCCTGSIELDSWSIDSWGDGEHGIDPVAHGDSCDLWWLLLDTTEPCDSCVRSLCDFTSVHSDHDSVCCMGIQNNCQSMENKVMEQFLGTTWWSILCVISGVAMGIYLRPWIMDKLGK